MPGRAEEASPGLAGQHQNMTTTETQQQATKATQKTMYTTNTSHLAEPVMEPKREGEEVVVVVAKEEEEATGEVGIREDVEEEEEDNDSSCSSLAAAAMVRRLLLLLLLLPPSPLSSSPSGRKCDTKVSRKSDGVAGAVVVVHVRLHFDAAAAAVVAAVAILVDRIQFIAALGTWQLPVLVPLPTILRRFRSG